LFERRPRRHISASNGTPVFMIVHPAQRRIDREKLELGTRADIVILGLEGIEGG